MAYQPLHHKYRPQTFSELVGQEAIATTLTNALEQQRIAPAYLLTGARGTGKTSSARILAKSLNCLNSPVPTAMPCGGCDVCRMIAIGSALDVIEIDAASNTGVDNIRDLIERAQFAPVQCRYKVYAIDECHMLSAAAFNALLKTLEEPPDRVVFVLATTDPQRVLPTIISRCQRFDFRRIPLDPMIKHLKAIAVTEQIAITDPAIALIAQLAQGGLRDAESSLDQLSLVAGKVTVETVWDLVGAVPEQDLMALLQAIAADNAEQLLDITRRLLDRGREPLIVLHNLASFYRDLLIAKTAPDRPDLVALTSPAWAALCDFAQTIDLAAILAGQQHLRSSEAQIKHTTQPRLWLELTLMGLLPSAASPAIVVRSEAPMRESALPVTGTRSPTEPRSDTPATPTTRPDPPAIVPVPDLSTPEPAAETVATSEAARLDAIWQKIMDNLHPLSKALLNQHGHLLAFDGENVRIGLSSENLVKIALQQAPNIKKAFAEVFNQTVKVSAEAAPRSPQRSTSDAPSPPPAAPNPPPPPETDNPPPRPSKPLPRSQPPVPPEAPSEAPPPVWENDETTRAAHQLAQFFGGRVVDMSDADDSAPDPPAAAPNADLPQPAPILDTELDLDDDRDVPF